MTPTRPLRALFTALLLLVPALALGAPDWRQVPPPLMEAFVTAASHPEANLDPILLAAWSYTETEWNPYKPGSKPDELGLFHMRDAARKDVHCENADPFDRFQDAICAARYLRLVIRRCGSFTRGLAYVKTGHCYRASKGTAAERVLRIQAEISRHRQFQAWRGM